MVRIQPETFHLTFPFFIASGLSFICPTHTNGISIDTYFLPSPTWSLDHWLIPISSRKAMNILKALHIQNLLRMHDYQFLTDVEHTLNTLEFCVLVDFRIRLKKFGPRWMPASIDEAINISISIHLFWMLPQRMLRWLQTFPTSFANTERFCSCDDGSCIQCSSLLVMKLQVPLNLWSRNMFSHHSLCWVDAFAPISCLLEENSLVDSLAKIRLLNLNRDAPVSWMLCRLHQLSWCKSTLQHDHRIQFPGACQNRTLEHWWLL